MAGHSKWANIKHRKAAQYAKRGKIFTKLIRELTVSAKVGGGNPADNPRLRAAVDKALGANMTRDTIDRAIARGAGSNDADNMEELTYEGYGAGGVAVLVEAMTDNRNRTVSEVRHAFSKCGGNLGTDGSVAYMFDRKGQIYVNASRYTEESVFEAAIEAGADDVEPSDDEFVVTTEAGTFHEVQEGMKSAGIEFERAELSWIPQNEMRVAGRDAEKLIKLLEALDDIDDVQQVSSNADIDEEILVQAI